MNKIATPQLLNAESLSPGHWIPSISCHLASFVTFFLCAFIMIYLSYWLPRLLPGDFFSTMYGNSDVPLASNNAETLKSVYAGKDGTLWPFGHYLWSLATLNWGRSNAFSAPVSQLVMEALPWTMLLMGSAFLISLVLGALGGVESAWRRGQWFDRCLVGAMILLESLPELVTGVLLLAIFAFKLGWFPVSGADTAYTQGSFGSSIYDVGKHLVLPLMTLVLAYTPSNFLTMRNAMVMVIGEPYVQTARAKGLPPWRIRYSHAGRNALLPLATRMGMRLAFLVTGALVVETLFSYPGMGTLLFNAIRVRDLPLIQFVVLISSLVVLAINCLVDIAYAVIDPRTVSKK